LACLECRFDHSSFENCPLATEQRTWISSAEETILRNSTAKSSRRTSLLFLSGLCSAAIISIGMDGLGQFVMRSGKIDLHLEAQTDRLEIAPKRSLDAADLAAAERAWRYFELNTQPLTGLADAVAGTNSGTIWDQGSYLLGLVAAQRLNLVTDAEFEDRVIRFLDAFANMPLFDGRLPNKSYRTDTLEMGDYDNTLTPDGIGWSALDVARMLMAFRTLERHHPAFGPRIRSVLARWDLDAMTQQGELIGATHEGGATQLLQEGRIGYEQYGARAAALWGLDVSSALSAERIVTWTSVQGTDIPSDIRTPQNFGAIDPVVSEPYVLQALELGLDSEGQLLAERVFRAQERRHRETGQLTAVSEDHVNQEPHFVYSSVYSNGQDWAVVSESGDFFPELRTISTKAAFAWDVIYDTEYTQLLRARVEKVAPTGQGWPAGIFEATGEVNDIYTLNTNAIILEALHFAAHGPLWSIR
jgi:hypothetical protein